MKVFGYDLFKTRVDPLLTKAMEEFHAATGTLNDEVTQLRTLIKGCNEETEKQAQTVGPTVVHRRRTSDKR